MERKFIFELDLSLNNGKTVISTKMSGNSVAEIAARWPETMNEMVRGLSFREMISNSGVTYESENGQETALVRTSTGSDDAGAEGQREGGIEPPVGL